MSETRLPKGIEEVLMTDPHVVRIHYFDHPSFPVIDYSLWRSKQKAQRQIALIQDYIDSPCIEDNFGVDHPARRAWRDQKLKDKEIRKLFENDPIRANSYHHIDEHIGELIKGYKGPNRSKFINLRNNMFEDFPDNYETLSFQEKLNVVNRTKGISYRLLVILAAQTYPS